MWMAATTAFAAAPDLTRRMHFDIPAGNIWQTMEQYRAQVGTLVHVRCNYCSGPQPCTSDQISQGTCARQCPIASEPGLRITQGCSLPCEALDAITTQAVSGDYQIFDALSRMLTNSGVTFALATRSDSDSIEVVLLDAKRHFDIPAGPTTQTADAFTAQSGIRLMIPGRLYQEAHTEAVRGYYTADEALDRMLQGTGLGYMPLPNFPDSLYIQESPQQVRIVARRLQSGMEKLAEAQTQKVEQRELKTAALANVQDPLSTLPVMLLAGMKEDMNFDDNPTRGTSANLRGLGVGATLVLFNGQRQPFSGVEGDFVDLSTFPWAAVDHIEVLPDGASAQYGSGAIAGVVNVIMRQDSSGAETRVRNSQMSGGPSERIASQLLAGKWASGTALFAYQFSTRDALPSAKRSYARDADKRPFGGDDFSSTASNPGTIRDPVTLLPSYAIPPGQNGKGLRPADLIPGENRFNWIAGDDLLPKREAHSAYLSASQHLGDRWELAGFARVHMRDISEHGFAESRQLNIPNTNAYFVSPFDAASVLVDYNFGADLGTTDLQGSTHMGFGSISLTGAIRDRWRATLTGSYGREHLSTLRTNVVDDESLQEALADPDPLTAFNPFGAGSNTSQRTLDSIRDALRQRATSTISEFSARTDTSFFDWRHRLMRFSAGASIRNETLVSSEARRSSSTYADTQRTSRSAFAELTASPAQNLDLSVAGRLETFASGDAFAPKAVLTWRPVSAVHLRGSWGRSYRAPDALQVDERDRAFVFYMPVPDPKASTGTSMALLRFGANGQMREEQASTWTAGIDVTSERTRTALSMTYFSVDYENRVIQPGPVPTIFTLKEEQLWANIVTRNPTREVVDDLCNGVNFFGSRADCYASTPVIIDGRVRNGGDSKVSGIDWSLEQPVHATAGELHVRLAGSHFFHFREANGSLLPAADVLGLFNEPPRTRMRASVDWSQRGEGSPGLSTGLAASYTSRFRDPTRPKSLQDIRSATELDLTLAYLTTRDAGTLSDMEFILNVVNITDRSPPFVNRPTGYDQQNELPYGRVISFSAQKRF